MKEILKAMMELLEDACTEHSECGSDFNIDECKYDTCSYYTACIAAEEKKKKINELKKQIEELKE